MEPVRTLLRYSTATAAALVVVMVAAAPAAANLLPNGDLERGGGSLAGWKGDGASVALRKDGRGGGHAARVARRPRKPAYSVRATLYPASSIADRLYRARGQVRSGKPGRRVCLKIRELTPAGVTIGKRSACRRATRRWHAFPELDYRAKRTGDRIEFRVVQPAPSRAGDSFQVDDLSLITPGDDQAPTTPGGLTAQVTASTKVALDWKASTDDVGVAAYTIYRRGIPIAIVSGTRTDFLATTSAGTTATYRVDAVDAAGRRSEPSSGVAVTTPTSDGVLIAAAGDIACDPTDPGFNGGKGNGAACEQKATSDLILGNPAISAVLALGDEQYGCGGYQPFLQSFDPSWGRFLGKIHPVPGNHEYQASGGSDCEPDAAGYFRYFGAAAGNAQADGAWNAGSWHMIALNGECGSVGGCDAASPQGQFLQSHLGSRTCTLAYWHEPYYNGKGRAGSYRYFWQTLHAAGADIILNGHIHTYARFAPQDADGTVDASHGIRQFIVGTGGKSRGSLPGSTNVELTKSGFGVLELRLFDTSYTWQFVATNGSVVDSGSAPCH